MSGIPETIGTAADALALIGLAVIGGILLFMTGLLPIPVGYERGKVQWLMWCGTGMHAHVVYWTSEHGFQTLHIADRSEPA